jgi:DNA repair protein RecO (recombination protein O)
MKSSEALLLRKRPYGDADYVLTLFTRDFGKINAFAKNAKSSRKRFGGRLEPFVLFRARFREKPGDMKFLEDIETVEVFRHMMEDLDLFMWGSFMTESAEILLPKESPNEDIFSLFVDTLRGLDSGKSAMPLVLGFQLGTLSLSGYGPSLDVCAECGKETGKGSRFSIKKGGALCAECGGAAENGIAFSGDFLRDRESMEIEPGKVLKYIKLFSKFTEYHTEKKLNSSKFIEELKI